MGEKCYTGAMNYRIQGGKSLSGAVVTNSSKNAAMPLLAASLLNKGTTTLKKMPRIEEVNRLIEVMRSIGVGVEWHDNDLIIKPPEKLDLGAINRAAAEKTRSIAMFIGSIAHLFDSFELPAPTGCHLGKRSLGAHIDALRRLGVHVSGNETAHTYHVEVQDKKPADIVMAEASDTGTENVLLAAAKIPGTTTIKFASANYMVQSLCVFLQTCGVRIEGIGTTTMVVHGIAEINADIVGYPCEDPIESMFFISLAATTGSGLTVKRCPIDFLELEMLTLESMGLKYDRSHVYLADNGQMRLVDMVLHPSKLVAPPEKIAARPYPGINSDNLPFFVPIATQAEGRTLIHDWMYEERANYYTLFKKLGADVVLADPHRAFIEGPTPLRAADMDAPPALRPATILLIGMLAAEGESTLRNVYPINRGYENLHGRLAELGASVEAVE